VPEVLARGVLGASDPVPPAPKYFGRSLRETLKMPPAKSPSPFAGKLPGAGLKV
jgi:hypothetical protein